MIIDAIIAIVLGYLLGSIPTAYLVARLATGKDIRQMGGGNVGGLNVFREVGFWAVVPVVIVDLGKGAAAVAIAHWVLDLPPLYVLLAGVASVVGHNWMVWLKFSGGKGMGAAIGAMGLAFPLYGYWQGIAIFLGIFVAVALITHNIALASGTSLVFLPLITWLGTKSLTATLVAIILGIIILIKYIPTARASWARSETIRDFIFDRWQRERKGRG